MNGSAVISTGSVVGTVDGATIDVTGGFAVSDRMLVKDQANAIDNGIYTITTLSDVAVALFLASTIL